MNQPLLSIVVPTKDRYFYLIKLIELIQGFNEDELELVIQDNTKDNTEILSFLKTIDCSRIRYGHREEQIPVTLNSDLAILNSTGKYVCFIGDDDGVVRNILDYVRWMEDNRVDSLRSEPPISYNWPDSKGLIYDSSSKLRFHKPLGRKVIVNDFHHIRKYNLEHGGLVQGKSPRIYCGIVRRDILNLVYDKTGSFFPGPSPDMASSTALSYFVKKHVITDDIIVLAGSCPKSTAGMGRQHKHSGKIEDVPWLPKDTSERWEKELPKYWTGETIYAESAIKAIKAVGHEDDLTYMNYPYFYGSFFVYHPREFYMIKPFINLKNIWPFFISVLRVFKVRLFFFIRNIYREKLGIKDNNFRFEGVPDIVECEKIVYETIRAN